MTPAFRPCVSLYQTTERTSSRNACCHRAAKGRLLLKSCRWKTFGYVLFMARVYSVMFQIKSRSHISDIFTMRGSTVISLHIQDIHVSWPFIHHGIIYKSLQHVFILLDMSGYLSVYLSVSMMTFSPFHYFPRTRTWIHETDTCILNYNL